MLNVILIRAAVELQLIVVADAKVATGREISAVSNDVLEQSQLERMLRPAIARVMLAPGLFTIILLPTLLQGTSV
jgi:hypothetical protein